MYSLILIFKVWDLRMGGIFETIHFEHAVTALQFDSRKIVAAAGENGIKVSYSIQSTAKTDNCRCTID